MINIYETPPLDTKQIYLDLLIKRFNSYTEPAYTKENTFETIEQTDSDENYTNNKRLTEFRNNFSSELLRLIREQDFEYGIDSPADALVRECIQKNSSITKEWLNELFTENYNDTTIITGIMRVISHFSYDLMAPQGITMALAALPHSNQGVREVGIRALENWGTFECLNILESLKFEEEWLSEYVAQVIIDLKDELM